MEIFCIFCILCRFSLYVHDNASLKSLSFIFWISNKTKMTGQQKLIIVDLPREVIDYLLNWHVLPKGLKPSSSAQKVCQPANSATDPLENPHSIIALFPSWGASCSRTTTCNRLCCALFCCKKRLQSRLLPFASRTVSSLYCWQEQEAAFPVWRTLESHQDLCWFHALVYYGGLAHIQPSCAITK